jgi:hypothetical protein
VKSIVCVFLFRHKIISELEVASRCNWFQSQPVTTFWYKSTGRSYICSYTLKYCQNVTKIPWTGPTQLVSGRTEAEEEEPCEKSILFIVRTLKIIWHLSIDLFQQKKKEASQ